MHLIRDVLGLLLRVRVMAALLLTICSHGDAAELGKALAAQRDAVDMTVSPTLLSKDSTGRVAQFRDATGSAYSCSYDGRGRLVRLVRQDEQGVERQTIIDYDKVGRLKVVEYPSGYRVFFAYPSEGGQFAQDMHGNRATLDTLARTVPSAVGSLADQLFNVASSTRDLLAWAQRQ